MVVLDFAPGLHGHFLEFVVNKYIFGVPSSSMDIFQSSGACHKINVDDLYQKHKMVYREHYSSFDKPYPAQTEKVIFIQHNSYYDFALLVNLFYRAHPDAIVADDFNVEEIKQLHKSMMATEHSAEWQLRNNWFTKLDERHFEITERKQTTTLPRFDFDYGCFFNLNEFVLELQRLSKFLNLTLKFDQTLVELWLAFIEKNQGYKLTTDCDQIILATLSNQYTKIDVDWQGQSYINFKLSRMFRIYDGPLFENVNYPDNSQTLYQILITHLDNFDKRF